MSYTRWVSSSPGQDDPAPRPKRQVSYNPDAVLCPSCTKRIRLNNSGRLRVHMIGKVGSDPCPGSNAEPEIHFTTTKNGTVLTGADEQALADEAEAGYDPDELVPRANIFSDR